MKLQGRVAIVSGSSPNIGGGIAEELASSGSAIVALDLSAETAEACARAIVASGGRAIGLQCDVTDEAQVERALEGAVAAFGGVDILVNNAARFNKKGLLTMSPDEWRGQISVMLDGTFLFSAAAAKHMVARGKGGVIINIISTAGHQGEPGNIAYSTAKSGLLNFTRSAAMELARHRIRVVSLTPTATDPDEMFERARRWGLKAEAPDNLDELKAPFLKRIPMGELPRPSDYGRAAVFLASDDAAMITGTDLRVDAGAVGRYWAWEPGESVG